MKVGSLAIVGCPNVGKSTLVNALVQQKVAIVSDKPQTTRTRVLGIVHADQGQLALLDTPGLHEPWHRLNKRMMQTALGTLQEADMVAVMVDGRRPPGAGDQFVIEQVAAGMRSRPHAPRLLILNKIDGIAKSKVLPVMADYRDRQAWTEMVPISAKTGLNLDRLLHACFQHLPEEVARYEDDFVTDQSMRHLSAEIIREHVLAQTTAELPYAVAVKIDDFVEKGRLATITATIVVEKDGQKGIVIGRHGARLKAIGTAARLEIERAIEMKVCLHLWVKVQHEWRNNDRLLVELGY